MEQKNKLLNFLSLTGNLILLNILYLVCCIPLVTIGASTTALYSCTLKSIRKESSYLTSDFFYAYRKNFKKSTLLLFICFIVYLLLACDFWLTPSFSQPLRMIFLIIFNVILIFFTVVISYVFPLLNMNNTSIVDAFKLALLTAFKHILVSFIMFFMNIFIPALVLLRTDFFLRLLPLFVCLGFSVIAYTNSKLFLSVIDYDDSFESLPI